ncbi:MAG: hypothetical protein KIS92_23665 [Planctomycetota bacterium]|nr:hypothetical protein [Planctomycetota bacterium]
MANERNRWMENAVLGGVLAALACAYFALPARQAQAAGGGWDTNGVMAVTTKQNERLVLIDTVKKNICVYKTLGGGQFRLVGARSYRYDLEVKDSAGTQIEKGNGLTYIEMKKYYESQPKK